MVERRTEKSKIIDNRERKGSGDRGNDRNSGGGSSAPEQKVIVDPNTGMPVINPATGNPYADLGNSNFKPSGGSGGSAPKLPEPAGKSLEQIRDEMNGKKSNPAEVAISAGVARKLGVEGQSRPDVQYYAVSQEQLRKQEEAARRQSVDYNVQRENEFVGPRLTDQQEQDRRARVYGDPGEKLKQFGIDTAAKATQNVLTPNPNPLLNPFQKANDVAMFGAGVGTAVLGSIIEGAAKVENGQVYVRSDVLIDAGVASQAALTQASLSRQLGDVEAARVQNQRTKKLEKDVDAYIRSKGIKKGDLITAEEAADIQAYIKRYNREVLLEEQLPPGQDIVPAGERRVSKNPFVPKAEERAVGVELSLRPVESATFLERTKSRGSVTQQDTFLILKKGEPELINPRDIQEFSFVKLEGSQKTFTAPERALTPDEVFLKLESQRKSLPNVDGTFGPVSTVKKEQFNIQRDVKELVPADEFYQSIGLTGAKIEKGDFFARIESLDLPNAKIFKREAVNLNEESAFGDVYQVKEFSVSGYEPDTKNTPDPFGLKRITRKFKDAQPKEDLQFQIGGPAERKLLTVKDAQEIIEFEGGFQVKIYTFDDVSRVYEEVEVYIPKKGASQAAGVAAGLFGNKVTTFSDIAKKNQRQDENIVQSPSDGGSGQESVLLQQVQEQQTESVLEVKQVNIAQPASESKQESAKQSFTGTRQDYSTVQPDEVFFGPDTGVSFRVGNKIYSPDATSRRVTEIQSNAFIILPFSEARIDSASRPGIELRAGPESSLAVKSSSLSITSPISDAGQRSDSLFKAGQRSSIEAIQSQEQNLGEKSIFRQFYDNMFKQKQPEETTPKIPPIKFDFDKKDKDIFGFTVEVRREGKFQKAGVAGDLSKAIEIGKSQAEGSAAASFRVKDSQGNIVDIKNNDEGFYKSKSERGVFIEKNKNRINTQGERQQITEKGIFANSIKPKVKMAKIFGGVM